MSTAAVDEDVALYRRSAGGRGTEEDDDDDEFTDDDDEEEGLVEDGAFFVFLEGLRA